MKKHFDYLEEIKKDFDYKKFPHATAAASELRNMAIKMQLHIDAMEKESARVEQLHKEKENEIKALKDLYKAKETLTHHQNQLAIAQKNYDENPQIGTRVMDSIAKEVEKAKMEVAGIEHDMKERARKASIGKKAF